MTDPWAALAWLAGRAIEVDDVAVAFELSLVRGDGSVSWQSELPIDPSVGGGLVVAAPRNGVLVYGMVAGDETQLHRVDAESGSDEIVTAISGSVVGTALDARGTHLFVATVAADELAIASVALDGSGEIELHREPSGANPFGAWDRLHATPDGRKVVLDRCDGRGCSWLVLDIEDGTRTELSPQRTGDRVDLSNDTLLATMSGCSVGPCPFVLVSLATGAEDVWDPEAHVARLGVGADGATILLHDRQGLGELSGITMVDPITGRDRDAAAVDDTGMGLGLARQGQDAWVPPGWELRVPPGLNVGEAGSPILLSLTDGTLRALPAAAP